MAVSQENVTKILSILSHPLRREILMCLSEKGECSFTDLMNALGIDTGKLSFHIRGLEAFLEQTSAGKYKLSRLGERAIMLIRDVEAWSPEVEVAKGISALSLADFKTRIVAFLIDFAFAFGLCLVLPGVFSSITSGNFFLGVNLLLFLILFWIYLTLFEGFAGQSLGKRIVGIRVVRIDGKKLFYDYAAIRNFGKIFLFPIDLYLGYKTKDPRFIRYFDKFSGTTVVDLRL